MLESAQRRQTEVNGPQWCYAEMARNVNDFSDIFNGE